MIRFFITHNNITAQLPVNPEELEVRAPGANRQAEVVKLGQIVILKKSKLQSIKLKSFFPATPDGAYVLTKGKFESPMFYINFFQSIRDSLTPARLMVTDLGINMKISIEDFTFTREAGDEDVSFELAVSEYRTYEAKVMNPVPKASASTVSSVTVKGKARPKNGYAVGDVVIAAGKYYSTSTGGGPTGNFNKFKGKISHIVKDKNRKFRFHITTTEGGYRGWVSENQLAQT